MLAAPIPAHEAERLAELRALKILDSPREDRFDTLVRLARHVFRVPIAYIALVDAERQWFKAQEGLDVDETPRSISFCGHAINQDGPLVVPDALLDSRFADNPLVTGGPRVRFYAGHPLAGPTGYKVGTLCLVDHEPREFDEYHQVGLTYLAGLVEQQLHLVDLIGTQRELLETKTALVAAQDRLNRELQEAREYIRSQLPPRSAEGPVRTDWTFASSSELGGDLFGDFWLDEDRLAIYLIDVCGHGVGAASIRVRSSRRSGGGRCPVAISPIPAACCPRSTGLSRWTSTTANSSRSGTAFTRSRPGRSSMPRRGIRRRICITLRPAILPNSELPI